MNLAVVTLIFFTSIFFPLCLASFEIGFIAGPYAHKRKSSLGKDVAQASSEVSVLQVGAVNSCGVACYSSPLVELLYSCWPLAIRLAERGSRFLLRLL